MTIDELGLDAPPKSGPKVLVWDIETAPALVYTWGAYDQNIIATERDWSMLMFSYKWLGRGRAKPVAIWHDPNYSKGDLDDHYVVERLHALLDAADVIVAHNGDKFDRRKANALFLRHGMAPPSPYQTVDTKKVSSREFANYKNTLDDLGRLYLNERKVKHDGIQLWLDCMAGIKTRQKEMERYANKDVLVVEKYYWRLLPWMGHPGKPALAPNHNFWTGGKVVCPKCGHDKLTKRGIHRTLVSEYQTYQCKFCKGYSRERLRMKQTDGGVGLV